MSDLAPVALPRTLRQSLLARADACRRSAYLSLKYPDQSAHELAFGSAAHAFAERLMSDLIATGQESLYAPSFTQDPKTGDAVPEDPVAAAKQVASMSAAMLDEVLAEHPEFTVPVAHPSHSVDHLRQVCYHLAVGLDVDPRTVLGLEQGFELDLECGWTLTGRIDLLTALRDDLLGVDDLKSSFNVESESAFEALWQMRCYPLLVMFGVPVERVPCPTCEDVPLPRADASACPECDERMYVTRRLPSIGDGIQYIRSRHLYPRYLDGDGTLRERSTVFSRQQIQDWRHDVERLAADLVRRFESVDPDDWPAISGSHCNECACKAECPLPAKLRDYAGTVNTREQASLTLAAADRARALASASVKEVREWSKRNGPVRVGDHEWEWRDTTKHDPLDWAALEEAVFEAVQFGRPFEREQFIRTRTSPSFVKRKLVPEEIAAQVEEEANGDGSSRFGDDAPW